MRREDDTLRVDAQLIDVATAIQVWSEHYDGPTKKVFATQDDITLNIAAKLGVNIQQWDLNRAKPKLPSSLSAYELFLRGREQTALSSAEGNARAIELFKQALDADSTYADAMGALAQAYTEGSYCAGGRHAGKRPWLLRPKQRSARLHSIPRRCTRLGRSRSPTCLPTASTTRRRYSSRC